MTNIYFFYFFKSWGGRVGKFWWWNSDLIPRTIPGTNTQFITWGNWGWGYEIVFKIEVMGEVTPEIQRYFDELMNSINSKLTP